MFKRYFLLLAFFFCTTAFAKEEFSGFAASALGTCNTPLDCAVYMAVPAVSMLINSIKHCKADLVRQKQVFEAQEKKNIELEEKFAKREITKATLERELKIAKKPEEYSFELQAKYFFKQLVTIVTDPASAITDQPFFTTMSLCALYRATQIPSMLDEKTRVETPLLKVDEVKGKDKEVVKELSLLPEWVRDSSQSTLTSETIKTLITETLLPKINAGDKFSLVWERIAAVFAGSMSAEKQRIPYLCLDGQPGVGKTYFAKELATALDYHCEVIECGLSTDRADHANAFFKGFPKTYQSAEPGRIVKALQEVKASNKKGIVIVLDEVDKIVTPDILLALLDPVLNCRFVDNYIETPLDLSQVIFIATSNDWTRGIEERSAALASRLQLVEIESYSVEEKKEFGKKQIQENAKYAELKKIDQNGSLIEELIDACDNVQGGVRKVIQLLDAATNAYALSKFTGKDNTKDEIKAKVLAIMKKKAVV